MSDDRIFHVNINVADLDRSIDFYRRLGFEVVHRERLDPDALRATLAKFGDTDAVGAEYALLRLGDDPAATCLDLVHWDRQMRAPTNRVDELGLYRIAVHSSDPASVLRALADAGIELLGPKDRRAPEAHDPADWFCVRDPDGTVVEIVSGLDHLVTARDGEDPSS
jgi:catechol 2,3-dioxygenase-like lactoylglutathione lyase family enzyme